MGMEKIGGNLLKQASVYLRALAKERDDLAVKVAALEQEVARYRHEEEVRKIAELLGTKAGYSDMPLNERINFVETKLAEGTTIDQLRQVVDMVAPDGSIGQLTGAEKTASARGGKLSWADVARELEDL